MNVDASEVERRLHQFKAACKKAGVKLTHQRLEIFREVAASLEHPDAEAVFKCVRLRMPTVSLDTVYRTLWLLNDLRVVTTLGPRRERVRFDANLRAHHHYVCVRCGLTMDFEGVDLAALAIPDTVKRMGSILATRLEVSGLCARCAKKKAERSLPRKNSQPQGRSKRRPRPLRTP